MERAGAALRGTGNEIGESGVDWGNERGWRSRIGLKRTWNGLGRPGGGTGRKVRGLEGHWVGTGREGGGLGVDWEWNGCGLRGIGRHSGDTGRDCEDTGRYWGGVGKPLESLGVRGQEATRM